MPKKSDADRDAACRKKAAEFGMQLPDDVHGDELTEWLLQQIKRLLICVPRGRARSTRKPR